MRASASKNAILFFFTISKSNFITYTIPFYNIPYIIKLYSFTFLLRYYFLIFLYYIFSIVTFFQDSNCNIFLGFELCFFFPDLHSPTLLNSVFFFQACVGVFPDLHSPTLLNLVFFFFFRGLHSPTVTFFMDSATLFFSYGDVDSNGLSLAFIIYFQQSFGLYHLFPTIFCFFKFNNYSKQPANKI